MVSEKPKVSVIIPTRNRVGPLLRCLSSVYGSDYKSLEVVVVDDASSVEVESAVKRKFPQVNLVENEVRRLVAFSRNRGASIATGELLFFLDDDNVIASDAIGELVRAFASPKTAVACPVIFFLDAPSRVWTSSINKGKLPGFYVLGTEVPSTTVRTLAFHDAFMVDRSAFVSCHGFDSDVFPTHFSEVDFAYRLRTKGYGAVVNPRARVWHDVFRAHMHVDASRSFYTLRNRIILAKKYDSSTERRQYEFLFLPMLTFYYLFHHAAAADEHRLRASANLLRGVVAGLASPPTGLIATLGSAQRAEKAIPLPRQDYLRNPPLVSVVIPTKDSATTLVRTLDSIDSQTYPNIEVIVVDNYSKDGTLKLAEGRRRVRCFRAGPQRSAQVNFGAMMAKGKYIYRIDSDFVLDPATVQEAVEKCEEEGYRVVAVHNTSDPTISFWSAVRKLERDCYVDDSVNIAARFFQAEAFRGAGGFDEDLIASEDYALHNKLVAQGYRIGRIRAKETHLGEPRSLKEVVVKNEFYGRTILNFVRLNPSASMRQLSPFRIAYFRHWRDFTRDPKLTLGFFLYQYVRYAAALAGFLASET
jgi:glycosyltransferase involved in cell wall biosynthesis